MNVVLVTNALDMPTRGNHTTIQRWLAHVRGVGLTAVRADAGQPLDPVPDVVHGYHALNGGVAARALAGRYDRPLVISLGGTDLYERTPQVDEILRDAAMVTGAFESFGAMVGRPYATVRRGVEIPCGVSPKPPGPTLRILLPAGLRPVKDPLLAMRMAQMLVARGLPLTLRILGPRLDDEYAREVEGAAPDFVTIGEVTPEEMAGAYGEADVVWNTSHFEGGANALLEAMAYGCACFARDVPGNRDFLPPENLFSPGDDAAVEAFHRRLLAETTDDREERLRHGHALLRARHDPHEEARALEKVWRTVAR